MNLKHNANQLGKIRFTGVEKGYEPLEVDVLLDEIIEDYLQIDQLLKDLQSKKEEISEKNQAMAVLQTSLDQLTSDCSKWKDKVGKLEAELSFQKTRTEKLVGQKRVSDTTLDQLNYIKALETELARLGGDPEKIRMTLYKKTIDLNRIKNK